MQNLIVALYDDHPTAVSVRTQLVRDGFATDRVRLTSRQEYGQADLGPKDSFATNVREYFHTLRPAQDDGAALEDFAQAVLDGAAVVAVHPRGKEEIRRAEATVERHQPRQVHRYLPQDATHVADRKIERAASGAPNRS